MQVDLALDLVLSRLDYCLRQSDKQQGPVLVIADEQLANLSKPPLDRNVLYLTNRYDVAASLAQYGARVDLSDFDCDVYPRGGFSGIIYRISKEKAIVNHLINAAGQLLGSGAQLTLIGHKQEGLNSYSRYAGQYLGGKPSQLRHTGGYRTIIIERGVELGIPLDDSEYSRVRAIQQTAQGLALFSKPGVYGWKKIDRGSCLLVDAICHFLSGDPGHQLNKVLDLGCGYGYLSVMLAGLGANYIVATDNNVAAVKACQHNFAEHNIAGELVVDDCAAHIEQLFDTVVCNPPFHLGFNTSRELTLKFLQQARHRLLPSGLAFFVVNQFIGIEAAASKVFSSVAEIYRGEGFKVLLMQP